MATQEIDTHLCSCGTSLDDHYTNPVVRKFIDKQVKEHGWTVAVVNEETGESYDVPRHYIALHGIKMIELPELAEQYGWGVTHD